jgi:hypothetical protein
MGVETNTNLFKFGNGSSTWTSLAYANNSDVAIGEISQDAINTALTMGAGLTKTYNDGANTITITVDTDVVSTKAFATSEATSKAAAAQAAAATYTDSAISGVNNSLEDYIPSSDRGSVNGVASLNSVGKVPASELQLNQLNIPINTSAAIFGGTITGTNLVAETLLTAQDVNINGNLTVNGTTTSVNSTNYTIDDPMIYIGDGNQSNVLDLGLVAAFNDGTYQHAGLVRDASDGIWKLFSGVTSEPTTTINFTTYNKDAIAVGRIYADSASIGNVSPQEIQFLDGVTDSIQAQLNTKLSTVPDASVTAVKIADLAVTNGKITPDAITSDKIAPDAVTSNKIVANAVSTAKIAADAVTENKIADNSISANKIATNAVTSEKIIVNAVSTEKIVDSAVTGNKIADLAVTTNKIADSAVSTIKIANSSVNSDKIANGSITTEKVSSQAITVDKISDSAITNAKVSASAAIEQSKIAGLSEALALKATLEAPTFTGLVVLPSSTSIGSVSSTEIGYLDGVTSSVQTQITAAGTALSTHEADTTNIHGIADTSLLATTANVATAKSEAITAAGTAADTKVSTAVAALTKSSVGLANVDNTADASKPVSTAQATAIATAKSEAIADATSQVNALLTGAPAALNTLDELAAALGDDANFASTVTTNLAAKAPIASPTFTGTVTVAAAGVAFTDKTQTRAGVPSLTTIATSVSSNSTLDALGTDAAVRDSLVPLSGAVQVNFETTGNAKYSIGSSISFYQSSGTGANFIGTGVTVLSTPGATLRTTNSSVTATKVAATTWLLAGDLRA